MASRPESAGQLETEAADDFILSEDTVLTNATFTGLLPSGVPLSDVKNVAVEIYRVFPKDSANPPSGRVPTRINSPSDDAFDDRDTTAGTLSYTATLVNASFTVANTVDNGIFPIPNQTTGGEGPATGQEVEFGVSFSPELILPTDHYFLVPQVELVSGHFLWLSAPRPTVPPFAGDLQAWIRNSNLDPDWLRVGTDIVDGPHAPTFNASFSLAGFTCTHGHGRQSEHCRLPH